MQLIFDRARTLFQHGVTLYEQGRFAEAEAPLAQSLALLPGRVSTLVNLGAVRLALGRPADALLTLDEAVQAEPGAADAHCHRAAALAALGRLDDAAAALQALLAQQPALAQGWSLLGHVEKDRGRHEAAREAFSKAVTHGADNPVNRYALAALGGGEMPAHAPRGYVQALFDGYAEDFERHLLDTLRYRGHEAVVQAAAAGAPYASALDLGCGTGLAGSGLRPLARRLEGVDLSRTMLERARALGVYDVLVHADLTDHLRATHERHDLLVAADVFIYVGALDGVFAGVRRVLAEGGRFVFTVEAAERGIELRPSLRYAHGTDELGRLASAHGFAPPAVEPFVLREEQRQPIAGLLVTLRR